MVLEFRRPKLEGLIGLFVLDDGRLFIVIQCEENNRPGDMQKGIHGAMYTMRNRDHIRLHLYSDWDWNRALSPSNFRKLIRGAPPSSMVLGSCYR